MDNETDDARTNTSSDKGKKPAADAMLALDEWATLLKGSVEYQKQKIVRNLLDLRGTTKRKLSENISKFVDAKDVEDNHYKKIADRVVGAVVHRNGKALFSALKDLFRP